MSVRRLLRGSIPQSTLDGVVEEVVGHRREDARVERIAAENWLSVPLAVDEWFVKVVSPHHARVHALLTTGRNLVALSAGAPGLFQRFETSAEMAAHELEATRRMRELGVRAPEPVETFEYDGHGVVVLEYLEGFRTLDQLSPAEAERLAPALFDSLARLHRGETGHGDLRAENVLAVDGEPYLIDATGLSPADPAALGAYDLACALGTLAPLIGARNVTRAAVTAVEPDALLAARAFLEFVALRPDLSFDAGAVRAEVERAVGTA